MHPSFCARRLRRGCASALAASALLTLAGCGGSSSSSSSNGSDTGGQTNLVAQFQEYPVPVSGTSQYPADVGSWPDDLTIDSAGNLWFAEHHADQIGRFTPSGTGFVYQGYPVPTTGGLMDSIVVDDARHRVWVSENVGNQLAMLDLTAAAPKAVEFPVATATEKNPAPGDLALDADGNPWYTTPYDNPGVAPGALGKFTVATGQASYLQTPTAASDMDGMTTDRAGNFWFVELSANKIARYSNGTITEFAAPTPNANVTNLTVAPDGRVWAMERGLNKLAVFNPADTTGTPWHEVINPTTGGQPTGVASDSKGNIWYTEFAASKIGVVPAGQLYAVDFDIPTAGSGPEDIHVAPDGRVFFTERFGNKVGQITVNL